jgi:hypothetical protein
VPGSAFFYAGPTFVSDSGSAVTWSYSIRCERDDAGPPDGNQSNQFRLTYSAPLCDTGGTFDNGTGLCDTADFTECSTTSGDTQFFSGEGDFPPSVCYNDCSYPTRTGIGVKIGGTWGADYTSDGNGCEIGGGAEELTEDDVDENCVATDGVTYCTDLGATNCGTVNGEYMCLDTIPPGDCLFTADGQVICSEGSGGVPGVTPDETIEYGGEDYDVYGEGAEGSTGTTTGGGSTSGSNEGEGDGDGPGEGGECDDSACTGELPGDNEEVDSFGDLFQAFWNRVQAAPIVDAFGSLPGALPAGSCSPMSSDGIAWLNGATLTMSAHCDLWPDLVPIIYTMMLAAWALLGGLIILRA